MQGFWVGFLGLLFLLTFHDCTLVGDFFVELCIAVVVAALSVRTRLRIRPSGIHLERCVCGVPMWRRRWHRNVDIGWFEADIDPSGANGFYIEMLDIYVTPAAGDIVRDEITRAVYRHRRRGGYRDLAG